MVTDAEQSTSIGLDRNNQFATTAEATQDLQQLKEMDNAASASVKESRIEEIVDDGSYSQNFFVGIPSEVCANLNEVFMIQLVLFVKKNRIGRNISQLNGDVALNLLVISKMVISG